ncbi:MAG: ABC transporter permease [Bacillota bacterium]|nr:ABC transporter permease [Bacillota bacterium]
MWAILWCRILLLRKNWKIICLMAILPFVFIFAFSNTGGTAKITLPIVDLSSNRDSQHLVNLLKDQPQFIILETDEPEAIRQVAENLTELAIIIPKNFNQGKENSAVVVELVKVKDSVTTITAENALKNSLSKLQINWHITAVSVENLAQVATLSAFETEAASSRAFSIANQQWQNRLPVKVTTLYFDSGQASTENLVHTTLGMALMFTIFTVTISIGELVEDKRLGIWHRLLMSPLAKYQLYIGNFIYSFLVGFSQISILIIGSKLLFNVPWGNNLPAVLTVFAMYILVVNSIGLMLAVVASTPQQLQSIIPVIGVSTSMLGGAFWPLEIVNSEIMLFLAKLTPQSWAISSLKQIIFQNHGLESLYLPLAALLLMAVFFSGISLVLIERKQ